MADVDWAKYYAGLEPKAAAAFLAECKRRGIDTSSFAPATDGTPPRGDSQIARHMNGRVMATDGWGRPVVHVNHALAGDARRTFEREFGGTATAAQFASVNASTPPGQAGTRIDPRSGNRVCTFGDSAHGPLPRGAR